MKYNLNIDDYIGYWGYSKNYIRRCLKDIGSAHVDVRISSMGGVVDDALDIRQQFIDHGDVTAYLFGYVASSATILATGAKKTCMSKFAFYLIHKVSNWVDAWGQYNADQIEQLIEDLKKNKLDNDKMDLVLANLYAKKCGKTVDEILPILKEGRWLTADEALKYGFVDEILEEGEQPAYTNCVQDKFNRLGLPNLPQFTPSAATAQNDNEDAQKADEEKAPNWFTAFVNKFFGKHQNVGHEADFVTKQDEANEDESSQAGEESPKDDDSTAEEKEDHSPITQNETSQIDIAMNTEFKSVNSILNVEGIEFTEGKCNLTEEQVKALNDRLAAADADKAAQQQKIDELNAEVERLNAQDGDDTKKLVGSKEEADEFDHLNEAKDLFNNFKDLI